MNVIGEPVDFCGPISTAPPSSLGCPRRGGEPMPNTSCAPADSTAFLPIHREAPAFADQSTELQILVTGIKAREPAMLGQSERKERPRWPRARLSLGGVAGPPLIFEKSNLALAPGRGSAGPLPEGRQNRPVRRRRRRQDRVHHGAHQQRRQGSRCGVLVAAALTTRRRLTQAAPRPAGGFSVFAGVGERTREGNDLYREMIESGVIKLGDKARSSARVPGTALLKAYFHILFNSIPRNWGESVVLLCPRPYSPSSGHTHSDLSKCPSRYFIEAFSILAEPGEQVHPGVRPDERAARRARARRPDGCATQSWLRSLHRALKLNAAALTPRFRVAGLTVAEYFRDEEGQDVLLFIDNIFRFTQACCNACSSACSSDCIVVYLSTRLCRCSIRGPDLLMRLL